MIPNERLYDDSIFLDQNSIPPEPNSLGQLLANLHLSTSDEESRRAGIVNWLGSNHPSTGLIRSIQNRGYGSLLEE